MSAVPSLRGEESDLSAEAKVALNASAIVPAADVVEAVETWRARLAGAGVACRAVALFGIDPQFQLGFPASLPDLDLRWLALRNIDPQSGSMSVAQVVKVDDQQGADLLIVTPLQLPDGQMGRVGVALAPPHNDRMVQTVLLALGWLQLALSAPRLARSQRAARLLDLLSHVASQSQARAAAQEWINRSAAWVRDEAPAPGLPFNLMLFQVSGKQPRWWVAADTAWAEKASPAIQVAAEVASQALMEQQEVQQDHAWAAPVLEGSKVVAVLVATFDAPGAIAGGLPEPMASVLRTSLGLAEPLLRRWHEAERPLWRHVLDRWRSAWHHLREPGHLAWKAGATGAVLALLLLLLLPVPDRVTATTVIEGRLRQVVTAPFDGFIGQVLVRPGERVTRGQVLARLDDRDLKLERARYRSEREQATGRLRQAMADREAAAMVLAQAEVQQAEAQLALIEAKLVRSDLTATLDGLVVSGDWVQQIGAPVETGKELFEIAAGEGYRVVLHVPDRDIARIHLGQTGALRLTGRPHEVQAFRISNLTATASVQDSINGFRVEAAWVSEVAGLSLACRVSAKLRWPSQPADGVDS
ncbi:efflux RND transporter periplasmic adaptor subunit [Roseateles sp. GG27B]